MTTTMSRADARDARELRRMLDRLPRGGAVEVAETFINAGRVKALMRRYPRVFGAFTYQPAHYAASGSGAYGRDSVARAVRYPATIARNV